MKSQTMNSKENSRSISSTVAALTVIAVILVALSVFYLASLNFPTTGGSSTAVFDQTVTNTVTYPCPSSLQNETSAISAANNSSNRSLDFAPVFGNFSEMSVVLSGNGLTGSSITTSTFVVLNRSLSGSEDIYEVNVTTKAIELNVEIQGSQNSRTTIVQPGNHTNIESILALVSSNGSVISIRGLVETKYLYIFNKACSSSFHSSPRSIFLTSSL